MAREILFKAKRIDNSEWVEGYPHRQKDHWTMWQERIGVGYLIDPNTLCQYTGLTDKNGNKIWENDVVYIPTEGDYFKIEWEEDIACFVMNGDGLTVTFDNYWSHKVEVYGSAFDVGELLGGAE